MNTLNALAQREWFQHRFGWTLLATAPLALTLLLVGFGQVEFGDGMPEQMGPALTTVLTVAAVLGSTIVVFIIGAITSLFIVAGLALSTYWMKRPPQPSRLATP